jgi:hypothetical protein
VEGVEDAAPVVVAPGAGADGDGGCRFQKGVAG